MCLTSFCIQPGLIEDDFQLCHLHKDIPGLYTEIDMILGSLDNNSMAMLEDISSSNISFAEANYTGASNVNEYINISK